ncbi:MAG TPA: phosphatase PAP2 family protein [Candidatus Wallbacteria bacterium]|nr:phosphatase PAP2 family protein [Candidatus Wallbacteria bacterium]
MNLMLKLDNYITAEVVERFQSPSAIKAAAVLTHLGDAVLHAPIFLYFYLYRSETLKQFAAATFFSTIIGVLMLYAVRLTFKRRRPIGDMPKEFAIVPMIENYSFPSGHALRNFLFCVTAYHFFGIYHSIALFFFAAFITSTRVYLKLHYFSDILAGGALGMATAYFYLKAAV